MKPANYYADTLPTEYTILGIRLLPLSAGHILRLYQAENSFILDAPPTIEDLAIGLLICSNDFQTSGQLLRHPSLPKHLRKWCRKLHRRNWRNYFRPTPVDWIQKFALFTSYISEGIETPNFFAEENEMRETHCPFVLLVLNELESKSNWTRAQLLDRPWKETLWDWLTFGCIDKKIRSFADKAAVDERENAQAWATAIAAEMNKETPCRS